MDAALWQSVCTTFLHIWNRNLAYVEKNDEGNYIEMDADPDILPLFNQIQILQSYIIMDKADIHKCLTKDNHQLGDMD